MNVAPTLHRYAGRCPPRGLIFLGAALRKIAAFAVLQRWKKKKKTSR